MPLWPFWPHLEPWDAFHNGDPTSHLSLLDEQLVLKLEAWIAVDEAFEVFPGGRCGGLALPMYQHLPHAPSRTSVCGTLWNRLRRAVVGGGQRWRRGWWNPHKLLEQPDMEDIMNPGSLRKTKPVGHLAHPLNHLEWASILGPQLAVTARN